MKDFGKLFKEGIKIRKETVTLEISQQKKEGLKSNPDTKIGQNPQIESENQDTGFSMCRYFCADSNSDYYYCNSPGNIMGKDKKLCRNGAFFDKCRKCHGGIPDGCLNYVSGLSPDVKTYQNNPKEIENRDTGFSMCRYFCADSNSDYYYCNSPGNIMGKDKKLCINGAFFDKCRKCHGGIPDRCTNYVG